MVKGINLWQNDLKVCADITRCSNAEVCVNKHNCLRASKPINEYVYYSNFYNGGICKYYINKL